MAKKGRRFWAFWIFPERAYAEEYLRRAHAENYRFFLVAFPEAERTVLGVFPDYMEPLDEEFPVTGLTVKFRRQVRFHTAILDSFLAQGVVRASLGDILAEEGRAVLFVKTELAPHFLSQIDKIGRVGVQITKGFTDPLPQAHSFQPMGGVVASERLDCLVAFLAGTGREKAAQMVHAGLVSVNHREAVQFRTV